MASLVEIDSEATFQTTLSSIPSTTLTVLYFHTPWAAPCAQMTEVLKTLASTYTTPSSKDSPIPHFLSINAEDLPEISESYDVTAVPFVVLTRDSKTLETISGSDAAKVRAAVEKHAGGSKTRAAIPPPLQATPRPITTPSAPTTNGATTNGSTTHDPHTNGTSTDATAELHARLDKLTNAAPVMLFMKGTPSAPECGFSRQLVGMLRENGVKYGFFNILADDDVRQGMKEYADWPTFPQLWTNGELVGGLDIVSIILLGAGSRGLWRYMLMFEQVKEEIEADSEFLRAFAATKQAPAVAA